MKAIIRNELKTDLNDTDAFAELSEIDNKIDKLLSLSILYRFLKTEKTQLDKFNKVERKLSHAEIVDMFISKEFREFISYEQVNFFLDNQDLFEKYL